MPVIIFDDGLKAGATEMTADERHQRAFRTFAKLLEAAKRLIEFADKETQQGRKLTNVYRYPKISWFRTGMPHAEKEEATRAPIDYAFIFTTPTLLSVPLSKVPAEYMDKFDSFMEAFDELYPLAPDFYEEVPSKFSKEHRAKELLEMAVCRYLYLKATTEYDEDMMYTAASPFFARWFDRRLRIDLMVPICLTNFDFHHFRLHDNCYVFKISAGLQKSRSCIHSIGTGVEKLVADAATHAFVSPHWYIEDGDRSDLYSTLNHFATNAVDVIEQFLASLRLATGIDTGYGQILYVPRGWAYRPKWDLPETVGRYVRRYPNRFDEHGWVSDSLPTVSKSDMAAVSEVFQIIKSRSENKLRIAIRRLNLALTREEDDDAILDAIIGLEILLLDKEPQSLSYKLRMRAAALSKLLNAEWSPSEVSDAATKLYKIRSNIVHRGEGGSVSRSILPFSAHQPPSAERELAIRLLRFVLDSLLKNPTYLNPLAIDSAILSPGNSDLVESDE
jgi:hypothetical protein